MRREDRPRALAEVENRVFNHITRQGDAAVERYLADAVYHEKRRLDAERDTPPAEAQRAFWRDVQARLLEAAPEEMQRLLRRAIQEHAEEIVGRFDPRVYQLATRVIPPALAFMLNASTPKKVLQQLPEGGPNIRNSIIIQGHTASLKRLHQRGRIILVPTHLSHLDSVAIGWVLHELNLPPFAYGAGLNLFTNPMLSFFMHNLGAYKVDRKKRHELYKDVLKEYCTVSLELGYDNLFFPGGTRGRSGAVETHLKLGLLGCGLTAYEHNLRGRRPQPRVFIVPATLSYHLVLEAETLIDDFLQEVGKSRYIIEDDESTQPRRVYQFVKNLTTLNARIFCTFGRPLDPFGNEVDDEGVSRDARGRAIDISRYVSVNGEVRADDQRDHEYTRQLGERIVELYHQDNVILSTHLTARAIWDLLLEANPGMDLYRLLRTGGRSPSFAASQVAERIALLKSRVEARVAEAKIRIDPGLVGIGADLVMAEALKHFSSYHTTPVLERRGDRIFPSNLNLVLYYQNRLSGYEL